MWRMGRDCSPGATCLTARTAFFIPRRGFKLPSADAADGEGLLAWGDLSDGSNCVLHPSEGFQAAFGRCGGWGGIRTLGALLHTRFPSVRIRPLCHPSGDALQLNTFNRCPASRGGFSPGDDRAGALPAPPFPDGWSGQGDGLLVEGNDVGELGGGDETLLRLGLRWRIHGQRRLDAGLVESGEG